MRQGGEGEGPEGGEMRKWNEFRDGQNPRRGEIIVVKGKTDPEIYPYILIADGALGFWRYPDLGHGTKLSFHGLTHWKLIETPY